MGPLHMIRKGVRPTSREDLMEEETEKEPELEPP